MPHGAGISGAVSRSPHSQRSLSDAGVVGPDGPTPRAASLLLSATRFDWGLSISYDTLVFRIKAVTHSIGLSADDYSGHSLRAGGATDLFVARVPYYIIQRMGHWSSDAALVYYRHEEDDLRAVSVAFQYVANPTSGGTPTYREGGVVV